LNIINKIIFFTKQSQDLLKQFKSIEKSKIKKPKNVQLDPKYKPRGKNEGGFKDTFHSDTKQGGTGKGSTQSYRTLDGKGSKLITVVKPKLVVKKTPSKD